MDELASGKLVTNMAMGDPLKLEISRGRTDMNSVFSIAMFDYRRVFRMGHRFHDLNNGMHYLAVKHMAKNN